MMRRWPGSWLRLPLAKAMALRGSGRSYMKNRLLPYMSGALEAFLQMRFAGCQPDRKERDRAVQALLRRGHRWDDVRAALDRYCASCGEQLEENEDYEL